MPSKLKLSQNPDGTIHYDAGPDGHVVLTGPITGHVVTGDGTRYDVTAPVVSVESHDHAMEVAHLVSRRYADEGHPAHEADDDAPPFEYAGQVITAEKKAG